MSSKELRSIALWVVHWWEDDSGVQEIKENKDRFCHNLYTFKFRFSHLFFFVKDIVWRFCHSCGFTKLSLTFVIEKKESNKFILLLKKWTLDRGKPLLWNFFCLV